MEDQRLQFVARLLDGESMTEVCRSFGISRKTGYKIFNRYKAFGPSGLTDRDRRPIRYANQLPVQVEEMIVRLKKEKPYWGARKIRELLVRRLDHNIRIPARSTVHAVLDRHGLVKRGRQRRRNKAVGTALSTGAQPNDVWCADYKGEFKLGDGRWCYPLTVTDHASRYILMAEAHPTTKEVNALDAFERLFREYGLPTITAPIMACPSPVRTGSTICQSFRFTGSAWGSALNGSSRGSPNRTVAMNACI